jgi:hypothetical protein
LPPTAGVTPECRRSPPYTLCSQRACGCAGSIRTNCISFAQARCGPRHAAMIGDRLTRTSALRGCWNTIRILQGFATFTPAGQVRRGRCDNPGSRGTVALLGLPILGVRASAEETRHRGTPTGARLAVNPTRSSK